jgi:hypothetical protein
MADGEIHVERTSRQGGSNLFEDRNPALGLESHVTVYSFILALKRSMP